MQIIVRIKDQYGQQTIIPVCEQARTFADIAGTKTLTATTIKLVKKLGYEIVVEQAAVTL